jgi:hypothetical protein
VVTARTGGARTTPAFCRSAIWTPGARGSGCCPRALAGGQASPDPGAGLGVPTRSADRSGSRRGLNAPEHESVLQTTGYSGAAFRHERNPLLSLSLIAKESCEVGAMGWVV